MDTYDAALQAACTLSLLLGLATTAQDALFPRYVRAGLGLAAVCLVLFALKTEEWWLLALAASLLLKAAWWERIARWLGAPGVEPRPAPGGDALWAALLAAISYYLSIWLAAAYNPARPEQLAAGLAGLAVAGLWLLRRGRGAWVWSLAAVEGSIFLLAGAIAPRLSIWALVFDLVLLALLWLSAAPEGEPTEPVSNEPAPPVAGPGAA